MNRILCSGLMVLLLAASAQAHFTFVVPQPGSNEAHVILSEDLVPDKDVDVKIIGHSTLSSRDASGAITALELRPAEHAFIVSVPGEGTRVVYGLTTLGVRQHGNRPGYLATYYPKAIFGDPFDAATRVDAKHPAEIVAVGKPGEVKFQVLASGKPVPDVEIVVILPDGDSEKVTTGKDGLTKTFMQQGVYGAWARHVIPGAGELGGKKYAEARNYPTFVAQIGSADAAPATVPASTSQSVTTLPAMPLAVSSFGAVISDGWLYVFGGHVARTHDYDTEAVTGGFFRLKLGAGHKWETLPGGPALQGMNIAAHNGMIYRVGGMQPRNARGDKADNYSVADCVRFNPATMRWEWLAPMPHGRSSHDVAFIGDKLFVVGGWNMLGHEAGTVWPDSLLVLDLATPRQVWKKVAQPFRRRALISAVYQQKLYVMGGMDEDNEISRNVNIYDPATDVWTTGPDLPGEEKHTGFAPAACVLDGRLYVSVAGGHLLRLNTDGSAWERVGFATPRIVHRLAPWQSSILVIGGADRGGNFDLIEAVTPADAPVAAEPVKEGTSAAAQKFCPIMTDVEVQDNEDAVSVTYEGVEIMICCSKCARKWKADPTAYLLPEFLPQLQGVKLPTRTIQQVYCPVYKTHVVSEKDPFVMYQGQKVYLFNDSAVRRWNANPQRFADPQILPQLLASASGAR